MNFDSYLFFPNTSSSRTFPRKVGHHYLPYSPKPKNFCKTCTKMTLATSATHYSSEPARSLWLYRDRSVTHLNEYAAAHQDKAQGKLCETFLFTISHHHHHIPYPRSIDLRGRTAGAVGGRTLWDPPSKRL